MSQRTALWETPRGKTVQVAIRKLTGELVRLRQGTLTDDEFRPTKTILGTYGQRQPEQYMLRVRLPYGAITVRQLRALADEARTYGNGTGHLTTRQDIQLHWLPLYAIPAVLQRLGDEGLITFQSGGNSVRNVAACPLAGACDKEVFDVTAHAAAVDDYYVGNPAVQNLPRKFKSSFSGCPADCALSAIQDFGAIAVQGSEDGSTVRGFRVYVGGGLGSMPRPTMLLQDFVPESEVLPTYEAMVRVFERLGDRTKKDRARLKFVVSRLGEEEIRRLVQEEREALGREGVTFPSVIPGGEHGRPADAGPTAAEPQGYEYRRWLRWNATLQRQAGLYSVAIALPLGDITSEQMETVATVAERFSGSTLRTSAQQNLHLRGLPQSALPTVYDALHKAGLTSLRAYGIADVTSCPGTFACSLAIASSKGLGQQLQQMFLADIYQDDEALGGLRVKLSGCPDACGHHYLGDIGLCAGAQHQDGHLYPAHTLYLAGKVDERGTRFGQPVVKLPARKVPQALERLLSFYKAERQAEESFAGFVDRVGVKAIRDLLEEFTHVPPLARDPSNFIDWDSTRMYILERGEGECSV